MTPHEFEQRYEAATTQEEKYAVLTEGLYSYSQQVGMAAAEYMDAIEKQDWPHAAQVGYEIAASVGLMNNVLAILIIAGPKQGGNPNE